jgi:hypothetical protein
MMRVIKDCTEQKPYNEERDKRNPNARWRHSRVVEVGEQENGWPGGDIITNKCMNCGTTWKKELPQ